MVKVPAVHHSLSTDRLLVMEEAPGRPIDEPGAVAASGAPPHLLAAALLSCFLQQILQGMVFHADPHPGNLMVDRWGRLWLLDFGAVGLLDPTTRRALQDMAIGMSAGEPVVVARAVRHLAGAEATADLDALESDIGQLMVETAGRVRSGPGPPGGVGDDPARAAGAGVDDLAVPCPAHPGRHPQGDRSHVRAGRGGNGRRPTPCAVPTRTWPATCCSRS